MIHTVLEAAVFVGAGILVGVSFGAKVRTEIRAGFALVKTELLALAETVKAKV